jgi:hypothetical protein
MTVPYKDHGQAFAKIVQLFWDPFGSFIFSHRNWYSQRWNRDRCCRWRSVESLKDLNLHLRIRGSCSSLESQTRDWKVMTT